MQKTWLPDRETQWQWRTDGPDKMTAEAFAAAAAGPRMGKHHGSEERRSPKIAPENA